MTINPKMKQWVPQGNEGKLKLPARTEIQIREAFKNIFNKHQMLLNMSTEAKMIYDDLFNEIGLDIDLLILPPREE